MHIWQLLLVAFALLAIFLVLVLIIVRRTLKKLAEDLSYVRHVFAVWFIGPLFRFYFFWLELIGHLKIHVNGSIPWNEERLIFVGNHPLPKLQDTFVVPIVVFFLQVRHLLNPIRNFPVTTADEINFGKSPFFVIIGDTFKVSRDMVRIKGKKSSTLEEIKRRSRESGVGLSVFYPEGGRTQSAQKNNKEVRESLRGSKLAVPLSKGAARLSLDTGTPIVLFWSSMSGRFPLGKPTPIGVLWGLGELLLPGKKLVLDIGHPAGAIIPKPEESVDELNQKIEDGLFELGDYQNERESRGRK